jgi:hypothetical protein
MPISISAAQQKALGDGFLSGIGEQPGEPVKLGITETVLAQYGALFLQNLGKYANKRKVVYKGNILSESLFRIVDGNTLQIIVPDYYDFPNEGVRGVKSSKNAPGSPYKYKSFGMSDAGRKGIKDYIASGHAKIETVRKSNDKALGIGREKKHLALIDVKTNTLVYLIKAFGIKKTSYFTDALKETFSDFEIKMSEAVGQDIVFTLEKLNRK